MRRTAAFSWDRAFTTVARSSSSRQPFSSSCRGPALTRIRFLEPSREDVTSTTTSKSTACGSRWAFIYEPAPMALVAGRRDLHQRVRDYLLHDRAGSTSDLSRQDDDGRIRRAERCTGKADRKDDRG